MKNLSRRMKRMLAILLVETIVAVNVISSYASDADGVMTFSEEEVSEMAANVDSASEGGSSDSEPVAEEPAYEEPAYEEPAGETPQEEEPQTEEPAEETPQEEEQQETPAEQEESGTDDPVAEEPSLTNEDAAPEETVEEMPEEQQPEETAEETSECTCEKSCGASEYDAGCPVCRAVADMDESEREAFLKDHCSKYEEVTEEEKDNITEPEIINKESNITITGTSVADGAAIEGASDFTITVSGEVTLSDKAPAIEGYEFSGRIYLKESGNEISAVKKETVENKETEDDVVVKIIKETTVSVYEVQAADWKALEADAVVVFEYTALEDEEEDADENSVQFYATCVDEDGNTVEGYEKQRLTVADALDLTQAPIAIEGYEYVEATVDGTVVLSVEKSVAEDAEDEDSTVYSYTTSDGSVEVSEDTTVTLTYQAVGEVKEVVLSWSYVDEDGNAIEGVEGEPEFEDTLVLDDAEKAPVAVDGYEYVEASIDGTVITTITKETEQTEEADAEPVVTYSYTTISGESVAIEEDTEITLSYEETGIPVKVDATVVDEFGDEIDEKYTNMELPEFTDGELVLDDVENPPVAKVQVRKSLFKVIKYTYVQATIDGKIVTGLKRETTKETADLKEQEFIYSYSTDGTSWTKLTEDTTVLFEYTDGKKTTYTYEDAYVSVTATLQHANAIPDDAEFVVTAVTPSTGGYNYDAYMDALNANAGTISNGSDDQKTAYDETNTLLYDIAFLAAPVDEEGNTIEGELVEYQPAEGMVSISISFKQSQLEDDLAAKDEKDITVVHMPLSDSVKESVSTTADATGISASDINVEVVSDSTSVAGEKTEFVLSDFSVVAVTAEGKQLKAGTSRDYRSILGDAVYYGVTANVLATTAHMDTNFAIGTYTGSAANYTVGEYTGGKNPGNMIMAKFATTADHMFFVDASAIKSDQTKAFVVTTTEEAMKGLKVADMINKAIVVFDTNHTEAELLAKVSGMVAGTQSNAMMNEPSAYEFKDFCVVGNSDTTLDITDYPAGTYYFNFAEGEYATYAGSAEKLRIKKNDDQVIVFNIPDTSVLLHKFSVNDIGSDTSDASIEPYAKTIIFNAPNATYGKTESSVMGVLLFPNAKFMIGSTSSGWLVADEVTNGGEWHNVWQEMPDVDVPTSLDVQVSKNVNGEPATGSEFTFTLEEWIDNAWKVVEEVQNNGSDVSFTTLDFKDASAIGVHYYRVSEKKGNGGYEYDETRYIVKAVVSSSQTTAFGQNITTYAVTSVEYYIATGEGINGAKVDGAVFNNIKSGAISVTKTVTGNADTADTFYFVVKDAAGNAIEKDGKSVFAISAGKTVTLDGIPFGTYTIQETDASGNAVAYDAEKFPYVVTYSSENVVVNAENNGAVTITNEYKPETVDILGEKVWNDNDNQDGARPDSITIKLWADDKDTGKTTTTTAGQEWKWSFTDLAKYADGKEITYTVTENAVDGYKLVGITKDAEKGFVITNEHTPEKTTVEVTKKWVDNDDQDGVRPDSITVYLLQNGTKFAEQELSESNGWYYKFENLDKFVNGEPAEYSVSEKLSDKDAKNYTTVEIKKAKEGSFEITNSHTPDKTSRTVQKVWDDNNNQDGVRPSEIKVILKANGEKATVEDAEVTLNAENNWTYTWKDLDLKAGKKPITYTVEEVITDKKTSEAYPNPSYEYNEGTYTFTITNKHTPATVFVEGSKEWNDNNNQDGVRPESITILLLANTGVNGSNEVVGSKEVKEAEGWTWRFDSLPKYANGQKIQYSVQEVLKGTAADNYTSENVSETFNIRNTHTPVKTDISGTKTWEDSNNQDGIRPESITVELYANGVETGKTATASAATGWKYSFDQLDKYANGSEIKYTVQEINVAEGYEASYSEDGLDVTNTHTPETITVSGSKIWDDNNNQDGKRPTEITVILKANGTVTASEKVTADASGNWSFTFKDLPKYKDGVEITYTVEEEIESEDVKAAYTTKIEGYTITNSHIPEKISISGEKTWDDSNNQDGKRPDSITVNLLVGDDVKESKTVTTGEDGKWKYTFTDLDKYANGKEIKYTVREVVPEGYTATYDGYDIENKYAPEKVNINGDKVWNDNNDQDGVRPESIIVKLYADDQYKDSVEVTAGEDNSWSWSFTDLPKYKNEAGKGVEIKYTISEDAITNKDNVTIYKSTITGDAATGFTITNEHTPETVDISGKKIWVDKDNQDGVRPDSITVRLYADGKEIKHTEVTAGEDNSWSWSFTDLPKYKNEAGKGVEIEYTISEDAITNKDNVTIYKSTITGDAAIGFTITNEHTPETVDISGKKIWVDNDDQDGARPSKIKITLYKDGTKYDTLTVKADENGDWSYSFTDLPKYKNVNGKGVEIVYTVTEEEVSGYTTTYNGYNITNTHTPGETSRTVQKVWVDNDNQDGIRPANISVQLYADNSAYGDLVVLNAANNWSHTWENLPEKAQKKTITYTVKEVGEITGYTTAYSKDTFTITNTHKPATVFVAGSKEWDDNNDQDGVRPDSITINLLADGEWVANKVVTESDNWSWKFDNLPKNKNVNGTVTEIQYSISEETVTGYDSVPDYSKGTFDMINTHIPDKTSINGYKVWSDNNDQDGKRPDSITVTLYADGVATDKTATVTADNNWQFSFTDIDKYANGKEIKYTVVETAVEGYTTTITGSMEKGYEITNSRETEKISVSGEKVWDDADNQDGLRPKSITVTLYANGKATDQKATVTASTDGKWRFTFENLDKYINGKEVTYTVKEEVVSGYTSSITGNMAEGFTIKNEHKPEKTSIEGKKTWDDSDNQDRKRPDAITVNLLADGEVFKSVSVTEADNWAYSFKDLDVYADGVKIVYSIEEVIPDGYTVTYDGYNIKNTYNPEKVNVNGVKTWTDGDNQDGLRPTSITVRLYADGEDTGKTAVVSNGNGWKYSFENLDKYKVGKEIVYTVQEDAVAGYTTSITGYNIENIHTPETIDISGKKTWDDADNQDGIRPTEITIKLLADGEVVRTAVVTASTNNWSWSFTDLPKYKNGVEIKYTITEDAVTDYDTEINGYDVKNSHKPVEIEISGKKTWNDEDNKYLGRPESITVYLLADGKVIDTKEVTDALGWTYSFTKLPKYAAGQQGHEIVYTIQEEAVTDYSTKYDGFDIENDYTPGETAKTVTKIWDDEDDQDGLRPAEIKVVLLANGETADSVGVTSAEATLNATNDWTYTWTDLPVKYNKKDVTYTVKELGAVAADGTIVEITAYTTAYSEDTFTITNTHEPAEVYVEGVKTWEDGDDQDGLRPESITVVLLADGVEADRMDVTPAADGTWSWTFDNLPKFAGGEKIQYSIEEIKVEGYESKTDYTDGKFNLINTHKPETVELSGSKTWNDANDQDGARPSSITIRLLADGVEVDSKTVTAVDNWSWTFKDLPKNKNVDGTVSAIEYTITEDAVDGYTASYTDDGTGLINSYTPEKTGRNVVKIWDDANNADQIRPAYIEVQLYADGEAYGDAVVLNDANGWSHAWTDLQAKKGGQYIVYTVQEITNVSGYTTTVTESGTTFTIVNYHPVTPLPTPTPPTTPPSTPPEETPTPTTPNITPTPNTPTPTPDDNEVLGARRGGAVLGARRGLDQAVLGKRRRPTTGDSAALIAWMITLFGAMGAATVSVIGLRKKEEEK